MKKQQIMIQMIIMLIVGKTYAGLQSDGFSAIYDQKTVLKREIFGALKLLENDYRNKYEIYSGKFSPDKKYIVIALNDRSARVIEVSSATEVLNIQHNERVISADFSPDGNYIATTSFDNIVKVTSIKNQKAVLQINHNTKSQIKSIKFSSATKYLIVEFKDNTMQLLEVATGKLIFINAPESENLVE